MPEILEAPSVANAQIAIYGSSGCGKTALATSLPWGHPRWGDRAIYVAFDHSSDKMESIHPDNRKHLILSRPIAQMKNGKLIYDPHDEACQLAQMDWKAKYPDVGTIIWDGGTEMADQLLRSYANTGVFSGGGGDKHLMVGQRGTASYMAQPMEGDYGMAQNGTNHILAYLLSQPLSVIMIFQEDIYQPKGNAAASAAIGGPVGAGGKSINRIASKFNTLVRLEARSESTPDSAGRITNRTRYRAITEPRGIWLAKLRKPVGADNPLADLDITDNPKLFWTKFEEVAAKWQGASA